MYEESQSDYHTKKETDKHLLNIYYNGRIGDWTLDFNADGMWNGTDKPDYIEETITDEDGNMSDRTLHTLAETDNRLYAAKIVAEHPFWKGFFLLAVNILTVTALTDTSTMRT